MRTIGRCAFDDVLARRFLYEASGTGMFRTWWYFSYVSELQHNGSLDVGKLYFQR